MLGYEVDKCGRIISEVDVPDGVYYENVILDPPPSETGVVWDFIAQTWSVTPTEALRRCAALTINARFEQAMAELVAQYPQMERESWPQQEKEARAWVDYLDAVAAGGTPTAPSTPMLDALSTARGVTKDQLAKTIVAKADAFAAAAGALIGKRQALEDAINAATTIAELEAIQW